MKFLKILRRIEEKLFCPIATIVICTTLSCFIFMNYMRHEGYDLSVSDAKIKVKIENRINECGKDYWISWLVVDTGFWKNKYRFKDVMGCNPAKAIGSCAFSVVDTKLNPFYNEPFHMVDAKTYEFLNDIETGTAAYHKDLNKLNKYPAIREALESSNKHIYGVGISVSRNFLRRNIIYVFTMTTTSEEANKCDRNKVTSILEDLSLYTESVI